jgi:HD-like signal output (HDOD) protein
MLAADTLPPEIEQRLMRCKTLPTLPGVAVKIIDLGEDPDVSMKAVPDVVSLDPALSARMLSIANSPLYAQRRSVKNLNQALMLLGLNATMSLALSFSLVNGLRDGPDQHELYYDRIWRRTMIAATAARLLSDRVPEYSGEDLFLGGLLRDVGILALDQVLSEKAYGKVLNKTDHEGLPAAEQKKFGVNHVQVGNWLLTRWRLPEFLRNAVGASHAVSCDEAPEPDQKAMALASRMADAMEGDADGEALVHLMDTAQALFDMDGERVA